MLDVQLKTFRHCSCLDFLYIRDFKHYVFFRLYEVEFLLEEFITKESTHMEEMFVGGRKSRWLAFHICHSIRNGGKVPPLYCNL